MLGTVLIALTCVSGVVAVYGPYQGQNSGYQQQPYGKVNKNNNNQDIQQLKAEVDDANNVYASNQKRLLELLTANQPNTEFRDDLTNDFNDNLRVRQANQTQQAAELINQFNDVIRLIVQIAVLDSSYGEINRQALQLERESIALQNIANRLNNTDAQQEKTVAALRVQLAEQERQVATLENKTRGNQESLRSNQRLLNNITKIQDSEQAESTRVVLTRDNPRATITLDRDFKDTSPVVLYGISNFRITDGSQSYDLPNNYLNKGYNGYTASFQNATLNVQVDVRYEPETATLEVTSFDASSNGFFLEALIVTILTINIDNSILSLPAPFH